MPTLETIRQSTACNLCSLNCGVEIQVEDGYFARIRGDRAHPSSQGYVCQKASRLGYGMTDPDEAKQIGPRINLPTSSDHCDPLAKTPYHKCVPVRLRPLADRAAASAG